MVIIEIPKNLTVSLDGDPAPHLHRWARKQWEEYLKLVYLAGYKAGMKEVS